MPVSNALLRLPFLLLLLVVTVHSYDCVPRCRCYQDSLVDCSNRSFAAIIATARAGVGQELFMAPLVPPGTRKLSLSANRITQLNSNAFAGLRHPELLIELDLSNNGITLIAPGAFRVLKNLEKLNLSHNRLHALNRSCFVGLDNLHTLILDDNPLSSFPDRTFASLHNLSFISIRSPQLNCDCHMVDFRRWALRRSEDDGSKSVMISDRTKCVFPLQYRNRMLKDLRPKMLKRMCGKGDLNPEVFAIDPSGPSVIFYPGEDRLLTCKVSNSDQDIRMEWLHNNAPVVTNVLEHREIALDAVTPDSRLRVATVRLSKIGHRDAGDWTCHVENSKSTLRRTLRLEPLPVGHEQCVEESYADEKGEFLWSSTDRDQIKHAPCPGGPNASLATRKCDALGNWLQVDTAECDFASETTRSLWTLLNHPQPRQLTRVANVTRAAAGRLAYFDVRIVSWIVGNTSINTNDQSELLVIASNLMESSSLALRSEADLGLLRRRLASCELREVGRVQSLRNLGVCQRMSIFAPLFLDDDSSNDTIDTAVEEGLVAALVRDHFVCSEYKSVHWFGVADMVSLRIPFEALRAIFPLDPVPAYGLFRFFWMRSPRLFDSIFSSDGEWLAENDVLGVRVKRENSTLDRLIGQNGRPVVDKRETSENASMVSPVLLTFTLSTPTDQVALGVWDEALNAWFAVADDICARSRIGRASATFACQAAFLAPYFARFSPNITYFTVLQNATVLAALRAEKIPVALVAWMNASAGFLCSCLLMTIVVHIFCAKSVGASTKLRHCLVNSWFSLCAVCLCFTLGIDKVHLSLICQGVGVFAHYSTLAALLWLVLTLRTIQRKTWKAAYPTARTEEDSPFPVSQHGPLVGLYFLAYGLPLIACSFALALDSSAYTLSGTFCFLSPTSGGLFYLWFVGPACLMSAIGGIFWLIGQCTATAGNRRRSFAAADRLCNMSATITTADDSAAPLMNNFSRHDEDQLSAQTSLVDQDLSPAFQIRTAGLLLLAYLVAWISAALYTYPPISIAPYLREYLLVTSIMYSVSCCLMGVLVLSAHVSCRSDLKRRWPAPSQNMQQQRPPTNGAANSSTVVCRPPREQRPAKRRRSQGVDAVASNMSSRETPMGQSHSEHNGSLRAAKAERAMQLSAKKYYQRQRELKETGLNGSALSDVQTSVIVEENEVDAEMGACRRRLTDTVSPVADEHDYYNVEMVLADKAMLANGNGTPGLSFETRF